MKIGIIGCGAAASAHIRALQIIPEVREISVMGRNISRVQEYIKPFNGIHIARSIDELAATQDGIVIATPNDTHLSILEEIVSTRTIPVLCEKPLTSTLVNAEHFVKIAHPLSSINFNYRFNPIISQIMKMTKECRLGNYMFLDFSFNKNSAITKNKNTWRDNPEQGSGVLSDLGSHLLDLVMYLTKSSIDPYSLSVSLGTRVKTREGIPLLAEDHGVITGITDKKIMFTLQLSKTSPESLLGIHLRLVFLHGEIRYSSHHPDQIQLTYVDQVEPQFVQLPQEKRIPDPKNEIPYWSDSFYWLHKAWIHKLSNLQHGAIATLAEGLKIQTIISAIST